MCALSDSALSFIDAHSLLQFRETIRKFCDAELAPYADQIDRDNGWDQFRPFWRKLGDMGLHGITAPGQFNITNSLISDLMFVNFRWHIGEVNQL